MTILAVVSSPLPSFHIVYLVLFLNSATKKNNFIRVSSLDGVTRGDPPPPSDATVFNQRYICYKIFMKIPSAIAQTNQIAENGRPIFYC